MSAEQGLEWVGMARAPSPPIPVSMTPIALAPTTRAAERTGLPKATLSRRLDETREISGVLAEKFDARASDDLTVIAAEAIKTLVFEVVTAAGEARIDDLVAHFGVSRMTIHRHVDALARQGMLRKLHGLVTFLLVPEAEEYRKTQAAALAAGASA